MYHITPVDPEQDDFEFSHESDQDSAKTNCNEILSIAVPLKLDDVNLVCLELFPKISHKLFDEIFILQILNFLSANDLCRLSCTSTSFSRLTSDQYVWKSLLRTDFFEDDSPGKDNSSQSVFKGTYVQRYKDLRHRIQLAKELHRQQNLRRIRDNQVQVLQYFIDFTQVRILGPLLPITAFLSVLLLGLKYSGQNISIWGCLSPLLILIAYVWFSIILNILANRCQYNNNTLFTGLWPNIRGPIRFIHVNLFNESVGAVRTLLIIFILITIQIILIALKLNGRDYHYMSSIAYLSLSKSFPWAVVFTPLWIIFLILAATPLLGCFRNGSGPFVLLMISLWTPFVIFFSCLTVKLNALDTNNEDEDISLALMLVPFWTIESIILVSSLGFLIHGVYRYYRGLLDRLDESLGVFLSCWLGVSPFLIFQALLSARENGHTSISTGSAVAPILLVLAWLSLISSIFACKYRTVFQEQASRRTEDQWRSSHYFEV